MRTRPHNKPSDGGLRKSNRICWRGARKNFRAFFLVAQKPLPAAPAVRMRGVETFAMRRPQIPLHQQADAMCAAPVRSDGIHTVSVVEHDFETIGRRAAQNAAAHAVKPVARLLLARQIIHKRAGGVDIQIPALFFIERQKVIRVEQHKLPRADFLEIIPGQRQRKFRHQRQISTEAIRAETVGVHARAGRQPHVKILLALGQCVGQRGFGPK